MSSTEISWFDKEACVPRFLHLCVGVKKEILEN